jgi:hypothetical protein
VVCVGFGGIEDVDLAFVGVAAYFGDEGEVTSNVYVPLEFVDEIRVCVGGCVS